jgi:hypothetical protein
LESTASVRRIVIINNDLFVSKEFAVYLLEGGNRNDGDGRRGVLFGLTMATGAIGVAAAAVVVMTPTQVG